MSCCQCMDCILILVFNGLMCFIKSFLVMLKHLICKTVSMLDVYIDLDFLSWSDGQSQSIFSHFVCYLCHVIFTQEITSGTSGYVRHKGDTSSDVILDYKIQQMKPVMLIKFPHCKNLSVKYIRDHKGLERLWKQIVQYLSHGSLFLRRFMGFMAGVRHTTHSCSLYGIVGARTGNFCCYCLF